MTNPKMFFSAKGDLFQKARMLRKHQTEAEKFLWARLRGNQLQGFRFKRQHPISFYIADFYCHKAKLVIELDGQYHTANNQRTYDGNRDELMSGFGLKVLRFTDEEVMENIDSVVETISNNLSL
jgi:very-short-patch-repair endonuclease